MNKYSFDHAAVGLEFEAATLEEAVAIAKKSLFNLSDGHGGVFDWYDILDVTENGTTIDYPTLWAAMKKVGY